MASQVTYMFCGGMVKVREEKFGAYTLLVGSQIQSETPLEQAVEQVLEKLMAKQLPITDLLKPAQAAIYLEVPLGEDRTFPRLLRRFEFKFHHFNQETEAMVFYRWNGSGPDKVPEYATSIEGGCAMVVDETGQMVLLVKEPGRGWKFVSEAVHSGELKLEAFFRGMLEELNELFPSGKRVALKDLPIRKIAGYNQSCAREGKINDSFDIYLVTMPLEAQLTPDGDEVTEFKWVTLESLAEGQVEGVWGGLVSVAKAYRDNPTGGLVGKIRETWNGGLKIDFTIPPPPTPLRPDPDFMDVTLTN